MADILDANGLQVLTLPEIVAQLTIAMQDIYGPDINVDQNSPDGQMINIVAQEGITQRELLVAINNGFDPDQAIGVILDQRVVINDIERAGGTFTIQPIEITVDNTVTLQGLDAAFNDINGTGYTVQDNAGNKFILVDTTELTAGTTELNFRAKQIGLVETTVNTITNPVTIVLGVTAINNSSGPLQVGVNEETDEELRTRRQRSVALKSSGYLNGLHGRFLEIPGVTEARLIENVTDSVDANGIPAHGIWAIVEGGANTDIANAIYAKKSYGANMKGSVLVEIITASGQIFVAKFDRPSPENLYVRFDIQKTMVGALFNLPGIKQYIVDNQTYKIGEYAGTADLTAAALAGIVSTGGKGIPVNMEISKNNVNWFDYLETTTLDKQFVLDVSRIAITVLA